MELCQEMPFLYICEPGLVIVGQEVEVACLSDRLNSLYMGFFRNTGSIQGSTQHIRFESFY